MSHFLFKTAFSFALLGAIVSAQAGTVISGLPSGSSIVNIDGRNDGAGNFDGGQNHWFNPFAVDGHLLTLTVQAGTYTFKVINPIDAQTLIPSLTSTQLASIYTAWSYNTPYVNEYDVFNANASGTQELFAGSTAQMANPSGTTGWIGGGWNTAANAYAAMKGAGLTDKVWVGGRNLGTAYPSYTFTKTTTLAFAVPDYYLGDNNGGVSVLVTPQAVPEPCSLFGLGMFAGFLARRKKRA